MRIEFKPRQQALLPERLSALPFAKPILASAGPHLSEARGGASSPGLTLCCTLLLTATVLQKIAIPGTGSSDVSIPMSMVVLFAAMAFGVLRGLLVADGWRLMAYLLFLTSTVVSLVLSPSTHTSMTSWLFLLVMQTPFIVRFARGALDVRRLYDFAAHLGFWCAIIGLGQFALQFVIGPKLVFPIETFAPASILMSGFNFIIPIVWNSPILKSNGVFFAEPSFFCQFLAIAIIVELHGTARPRTAHAGERRFIPHAGRSPFATTEGGLARPLRCARINMTAGAPHIDLGRTPIKRSTICGLQ